MPTLTANLTKRDERVEEQVRWIMAHKPEALKGLTFEQLRAVLAATSAFHECHITWKTVAHVLAVIGIARLHDDEHEHRKMQRPFYAGMKRTRLAERIGRGFFRLRLAAQPDTTVSAPLQSR